ncbi:hypothetical protein LIX60_14915 [Streptomyces sp. S07_1.15]|nr:hypothetical protein [Streptomyces sp. S07_1.15]MCC3652730.1 hypothetical protein [Streptomyces sp. S07_1.15]
MWRTPQRVRGASDLGARQAGEHGPYGKWPTEDDDQDDAEPQHDDHNH